MFNTLNHFNLTTSKRSGLSFNLLIGVSTTYSLLVSRRWFSKYAMTLIQDPMNKITYFPSMLRYASPSVGLNELGVQLLLKAPDPYVVQSICQRLLMVASCCSTLSVTDWSTCLDHTAVVLPLVVPMLIDYHNFNPFSLTKLSLARLHFMYVPTGLPSFSQVSTKLLSWKTLTATSIFPLVPQISENHTVVQKSLLKTLFSHSTVVITVAAAVSLAVLGTDVSSVLTSLQEVVDPLLKLSEMDEAAKFNQLLPTTDRVFGFTPYPRSNISLVSKRDEVTKDVAETTFGFASYLLK